MKTKVLSCDIFSNLIHLSKIVKLIGMWICPLIIKIMKEMLDLLAPLIQFLQ